MKKILCLIALLALCGAGCAIVRPIGANTDNLNEFSGRGFDPSGVDFAQ
jgi:hypothetical protein